MTITSTAPVIDENGITAPSYADIYAFLVAKFQGIYGADTYLGPDSQDGEWLGVIATAINDANAIALKIYGSFSPATAVGAALASNVKINGIAKAESTFSTVDLLLVGQAGTTITNGIAGQKWALPPTVVIPSGGAITVTATCTQTGQVSAPAGTITTISTPTLGWQSVMNPSDAVEGAPVESDATLRKRQAVSVAIPSRTVLEGTVGAVASVVGVTRYRPYENDTSTTDGNGIPSHSISLVVEGGDATEIATAIAAKKAPGTGTFGTTTIVVNDIYGIPHPISFFRPTDQAITATVTLKALAGYTTAIGQSVQQAVSDYVNAVDIGGGESGTVEWADAITSANSVPGNTTFKITALSLSGPGGAGAPDVPLAFNQAATCAPASVTLTVS